MSTSGTHPIIFIVLSASNIQRRRSKFVQPFSLHPCPKAKGTLTTLSKPCLCPEMMQRSSRPQKFPRLPLSITWGRSHQALGTLSTLMLRDSLILLADDFLWPNLAILISYLGVHSCFLYIPQRACLISSS